MSPEEKRRSRRRLQAIGGVIAFGALLPGAAFVLVSAFNVFDESGLYGGLGVAFAAYVAHAFLLDRRAHNMFQWAAVSAAILIGGTFGVWFPDVVSLFMAITVSRQPQPPGVPGDLGFLAFTVCPIIAGSGMSLVLWAASRRWTVAIGVFIGSAFCGLIAIPSVGASCILWHIIVSTVLYSWACSLPLSSREPGPPTCDHCGYSLQGLPGKKCPECGNTFSKVAATDGSVSRSEFQVQTHLADRGVEAAGDASTEVSNDLPLTRSPPPAEPP